MKKTALLLTFVVFGAMVLGQGQSQIQAESPAWSPANGPTINHTGSGLRYGGEVFWPFLETNLWDPTMWDEDLLPLFQEQHLSLGPWGFKWCNVQSQGEPADPDTWDWNLVDAVARTFASSSIEPFFPITTGDCELTADTEIEDSSGYPPAEGRWDDWYRFVVAVADRYDGTHPDPENAGQTLPRVRYFELVPENDQPQFWAGTPEELYGFDASGNPIAAAVDVAPGVTLPKAMLPIFYAGIHHDPAREAQATAVIAGSHTTIYAMGSRLVERKRDQLQADGDLSPADIQELLGFARLIYTYYEDHDTNHLVDSPNGRQFPDYADLELWLDQTARYRSFIDPFFDAHAYYDVVGLHNFLGYQAFEDYLAYVRQEMRDHGIDGYPIWITELGHVDSDRACWLALFCTPTQPDGQETETEHAQSMEKKLVLAAHFGVDSVIYSALIELPPPASPCVDDDVDSPHPCVSMGFWTPYEVSGTTLVINETIPLEAADALRFASGVFNADFAYQSRRENLSPKAKLYVFDGDDGLNHVAVGWCEVCGEGETYSVDIALGIGAGTRIAVHDYLGNLPGDPHSHTITFTEAPVFITWQSPATPTSTASPTPTPTPTTEGSSPTPTPTTITPPASQCVQDANANGVGDVVDIEATGVQSGCQVYLPVVVANWRQPWPTATPTPTATSTATATSTPTATTQPFQLQHLRTVTITADAEGGGARPEIVFANGRFFVVYLGNILSGAEDQAFKVKVFDQDLTTEITARDLITASAEYGGPTDIRATSDGEHLYAFFEVTGQQQGAHLFGAKYALTDDFPRVAYTTEPIATAPYYHDTQPGDERLDDPAPVLSSDAVFVMTKVRTGITPDADTLYRLRELTTDLVPVGSSRDLDLSQVADGGANVNGLLYLDGSFYTVLSTTIAPQCGPGGGPDVADSDLMMIRFDENWTYDPATDVWTLSRCPELERYISGFDYDDGYFYVAHHATPRTWTCEPGGPPAGPGPGEIVWLKVFDTDLNLVDAVKVSGDAFGNHPTVEVVGDRVYVAYQGKETQDARGNVVVEIYRKVPREEGYQPQFCGEGSSAPTLASCQAWIREQHTLDYPDHGCQEHADILNAVASNGAGAIPLGDSKFFITWFPDDWESLSNRKLIVTLHGSGGCTERVYQWWARPASERNYALVALQYARQDETTEEGYAFDDSDQIYANLRTIFDQLQTYCPLEDTAVVYHGFSRGSARSFKLGLLDRAEDGMNLFTAFIADSGTELAETGGEIPAYLQNAPPDAYSGAPYWLYCGGQDHDGQTCDDMRRLGPVIEEHGATVTTYRYEPGGHGIFSTVRPGGPPSLALNAMFEYIDALEAR